MNKILDWWQTDGGSEYMKRNAPSELDIVKRIRSLYSALIGPLEVFGTIPQTILEVGCGPGANLVALSELLPETAISAVEPNGEARQIALNRCTKVTICEGSTEKLDWPDSSFDLVMTAGVLIHVSPDKLKDSMSEIARVTKKYVLCIEYFAPQSEPVMYHGDVRLWRNNFGKLYQDLGLNLVDYGFFVKEIDGFDNCVWWLLEK